MCRNTGTLFDSSLKVSELEEEYLSCAFGEDWRLFRNYLESLNEAFDFKFISGQASVNPDIHNYYNPEMHKRLLGAEDILNRGLELIKAHYNFDERVRTVSVRLLEMHAKYCSLLAKALALKALARDEEALKAFDDMRHTAGQWEAEYQTFYDHSLVMYSIEPIFKQFAKSDVPIYRLDN